MAADYEFFSRPEWAGLQKAYGLSFRAQRQMQPDFMYAAVASGEREEATTACRVRHRGGHHIFVQQVLKLVRDQAGHADREARVRRVRAAHRGGRDTA